MTETSEMVIVSVEFGRDIGVDKNLLRLVVCVKLFVDTCATGKQYRYHLVRSLPLLTLV